MLGGFEVLVDSRPVPAEAWAQRRATDLVKLLALASGHRLPRDEVLETLWPKLGTDAAASNLHKAASYARRALGDRGAIVLRGGMVELAPDAEVTTDVERFERGDVDAYRGDLLPDEPYAEWTLGPREALRERRLAADALAGPLGGGAPRGSRRRGGASCVHAPSRGEWRQAGRCAPVPAAARGAVAAGHRAVGGDARTAARAHSRPGGARDAAPPRARRGARARTRLGARARCNALRRSTGARC